jgi:alpha-mannosidase
MQNKEYQKQLQQLQWKEEVTVEGHVTEGEKKLNIFKYNRNKSREAMARELREWRKIIIEAKIHNRP